MNFSTKMLPGIVLIALLLGCTETPRRSVDFTPEFSFTEGIEGPAVNAAGELFAVNFETQGTIGKVNSQGAGEVYLKLPEGSIGNGIRFDVKGNMFIADYLGHAVYRVPTGTRTLEVWVQDSTMNQPNDLAIAPTGHIYLSDPDWAENTGKLWMISPARELRLLEDQLGTTNGIEVSADGRKLYLNESVQRRVWQYEIKADGTLANKTPFISFEDHGLDGMRSDREGNLYITRYGKGTVVIVSPEGKILEEVHLKGKKPSNITFGGSDGKSCFVTMADRGCIETFEAPYPGNYFIQVH